MTEQPSQQPPKPIKEKKTIYDVGYGSIFFRNFLAGFARGLGAITVYIFLGGIIYYLSVTYIIPQIKNIIPTTLPTIPSTVQVEPGTQPTPEELKEALKYLEQKPEQTTPQ